MAKATDAKENAIIENVADQFEHDELGYVVSTDVLERFDPANIDAFVEALGLTQEDLVFNGDPYPIVEDKTELVDVPLFLVQWDFGFSQRFQADYVSAKAIRLDTGEKCTIFDSGTGIYAQLDKVTNYRMRQGHAAVRQGLSIGKGLQKSEYPANDQRPAGTTFYLG